MDELADGQAASARRRSLGRASAMSGTVSASSPTAVRSIGHQHDHLVLVAYEGELLAGREAVLQLLGGPVLARARRRVGAAKTSGCSKSSWTEYCWSGVSSPPVAPASRSASRSVMRCRPLEPSSRAISPSARSGPLAGHDHLPIGTLPAHGRAWSVPESCRHALTFPITAGQGYGRFCHVHARMAVTYREPQARPRG